MKTITRAPSIANCNRTSTYLTKEDEILIDNRDVKTIVIYDQVLDREYEIDAKLAKDSLLEKVYNGEFSQYRCFNWGPLISKSSTPSFTHLTQKQAAEMFDVDPNRICELHRFDFLQPISKIGTSLFYLKDDVLKALKESRVQFWMKSLGGK